MAVIVVADTDLRTAKAIKEILASREEHDAQFYSDKNDDLVPFKGSLDQHTIFYARNNDPLFKFLQENPADIVFVNDRFPDDDMTAWITRLRKQVMKENNEIPVAVLSYEEDQDFVRSFLETGMADFFCVPLDWPLFIQKFELLLTKKVASSARQLYELRITKPIDMATIQEIEEISEFGIKIKSTKPVTLGEIRCFYSEAFLEHRKGEVLARCYASDPHPTAKGFYRAHFVYLGVPPKTLQNIRRWIRQQYAIKKQAD